ncbi:MAG: SpoIIE family protein phosphatase, partial [Planctomycetota bacterium JB042]
MADDHHEALVEIGQLEGLAESLRSELLPTSTPRPDVTVAVDYVPAMNAIGFGGDWFDTVDPHPDRLVLVVGDVAGHGVAAAARMALAQGAIRGLAMRSAMSDVPRLATRALTGARREFFATLGIIQLDLAAMTISCALAGHPPPMMRTTDGVVTRLGGAPQP